MATAQAIGREKARQTGVVLRMDFPRNGVHFGITFSQQFLLLRGATHRRHALYLVYHETRNMPNFTEAPGMDQS